MAFWDVAGSLALGVGSSLLAGLTGAGQKSQAGKINPVDPGYQVNQNTIDNAKILSDKYNDYVMPGYDTAKANLDNNFATSMYNAREGATSSTDVLDAANKLDYNKNTATNNLAATSAQMKENLLPQVLQASAAAGNEYVLKNKFDNERYDQQVNAKAALNQAGNINEFNAADSLGRVGNAFLSYKSPNSTATPGQTTVDPSIFDSGMSTLNGYTAQKKNASKFGFSNYVDPNTYA